MARNIIAHLDMDAFYASVELLRYPELRGKPVVIGGGRRHQPAEYVDPVTQEVARTFSTLRGYAGRGVTTTATYEARALGLHSAMGMMKAAALAPDAVLLPVDFDAYRHYSRLFKAAVRAVAPHIEDRGIDEIYIDLTECRTRRRRARWRPSRSRSRMPCAKRRRCRARSASHRTSCSRKSRRTSTSPNGLTLLGDGDLERRIWPLPARRINGIGPKSAARLADARHPTPSAISRAPIVRCWSRSSAARYGAWMHEAAHGRDERPVVTYSEPQVDQPRDDVRPRSVTRGAIATSCRAIFTELCNGVGDDLQRKGYVGKTIGVKLRYDNFRTVTRDRTIAAPTQDATVIRRAAGECLKRVPLERRIRLLGVRAGGLVRADAVASMAREPDPPSASASLFE